MSFETFVAREGKGGWEKGRGGERGWEKGMGKGRGKGREAEKEKEERKWTSLLSPGQDFIG